jgi:hypothetical protein
MPCSATSAPPSAAALRSHEAAAGDPAGETTLAATSCARDERVEDDRGVAVGKGQRDDERPISVGNSGTRGFSWRISTDKHRARHPAITALLNIRR